MERKNFDGVSCARLPAAQSALDEPRLVTEMGIAARIAHVAQPVLAGLGYRLVRVKLSAQAGMTVQIMAERPDGSMTVDDCALASEALSPALDVEDLVKSAYRLEVSSPGIDRPLVRVSDFREAVGREARVEMNTLIGGRKRFRGRIKAVEGEGPAANLILECSDSKPGEPGQASLSLQNIAEAKLVLSEALLRQSLRASKTPPAGESALDEERGIEGRKRAKRVKPPASRRSGGSEPERGD
jgi:ribosome maturation factor RimP